MQRLPAARLAALFWGLTVVLPVGVNYLAATLMLATLLAGGHWRARAVRLRRSPMWWPLMAYVVWTLVVLAIEPHYPQTGSNLGHGLRIAATVPDGAVARPRGGRVGDARLLDRRPGQLRDHRALPGDRLRAARGAARRGDGSGQQVDQQRAAVRDHGRLGRHLRDAADRRATAAARPSRAGADRRGDRDRGLLAAFAHRAAGTADRGRRRLRAPSGATGCGCWRRCC